MPNKEAMTKTEQAIFDILSDGRGHKRKDIHKAVCGPSEPKTVNIHICNLRKKLPAGLEILAVASQYGLVFRLVRQLTSAQDG
jgi:DNA-binding response OmpR family regulator